MPCAGGVVQSEFYQLRRTAIKDLTAYCGFLAGFLGSAPFAWRLLAVQLEGGNFARGLWYFLGVVAVAGICAGIVGLGVGFVAGGLWEQYHRHRRRERLKQKAEPDVNAPPTSHEGAESGKQIHATAPMPITPRRLHLVSSAAADPPDLTGRRLMSVRFLSQTVEFDFGGLFVALAAYPVVSCGGLRCRFPEAGSRDSLCRLIGSTVSRMRVIQSEVELRFDADCELIIPLATVQSAVRPA